MRASVRTRTAPLIVLGLKVGDPASLERWAAEGRLPTIASLIESGCHGRLADPTRVSEHGAATTLFSGWPADRHGFYYFRQLVPGSYRLERFGSENSGARPFWARPELFEGSVAVIDVPEGRPHTGVKGHQIVNWGLSQTDLNLSPRSSEPPDLLEEVNRRFGVPADILGETADQTTGEDLRSLDDFLASVRTKGELCRHILSLDEPDLVVAFFDETHTASHRYWPYRSEAANGGAEEERLRNAIRTVYQAVDDEMGRILAALGGEPNVVFVSLFGMQDQFPTEELNSAVCHALGYQARREASAGGRRPIDIARRILPERLRAAISRRLPGRRQEALLADLFASGTDWGRTTAFGIPSLYTGLIRVNLRGREPEGIVELEEYDRVLDLLESDLMQLSDAETGEPAIDTVVRTIDVFGGGPPERLPDLFVEWKPGPRLMRRVRHPRAELTQRRPSVNLGSEETLTGYFAAMGPDIGGRGPIDDVAMVDFAPTVLRLLGTNPPEDMPGRVRTELLASP